MAGLAATTQLGSNALTLVATTAPAATKKKNSGSSSLRIQAACLTTQPCECTTMKAGAMRRNGGGLLETRMPVRVNSSSGTPSESSSMSSGVPPAAAAGVTSTILCKSCDGNGAVVCSQCEGEGINKEDHFAGRFKTGGTCWLCRGKRQMLCGNCNGAGFMGGFMNTQDD